MVYFLKKLRYLEVFHPNASETEPTNNIKNLQHFIAMLLRREAIKIK